MTQQQEMQRFTSAQWSVLRYAAQLSCPLERAFRDVHAMTQHIAVQPRVMQSTGRVLFGLESDTPLL